MRKINWHDVLKGKGGPDEGNAATRYEIQRQAEHCADCKRNHLSTISCDECKAQGGDK